MDSEQIPSWQKNTRCLANQGRKWEPAIIHRRNADGTFEIEFDKKEMEFLPYWYSMTRSEISINDKREWSTRFKIIKGVDNLFGISEFKSLVKKYIFEHPDKVIMDIWLQICKKLFNLVSKEAENARFNSNETYKIILLVGLSAKGLKEKQLALENKITQYYRLYWNQIRMGGRQPEEISRPLQLQDLYDTLGITSHNADKTIIKEFKSLEAHFGVQIPECIITLFSIPNIYQIIQTSHPNAPELVLPDDEKFTMKEVYEYNLKGKYAMKILRPHQGSHQWMAIFNSGDEDASVYVYNNYKGEDYWNLTAPSIIFFFWDLSQTGLAWYQSTKYKGGKKVIQTDIGLIPDSSE